MEDGLYFLGDTGWQWVAEVDFVLNIQANDLTSPDTLELSYTNQFTLPNTLAIRQLLDNAEHPNSASRYPYILIPARLVENEGIIFEGRAELKSFQAGWKVAIYETHRGLFDRLAEKSIRDLDFSRLDHPWTLDEINARAGADSDICYPLIDYGTISEGVVPQDAIFPAVFMKTVIGQSLQQEGYKPAGAWLEDPLFQQMIIPFTEEVPKNRDQKWVDARMARVTLTDGPVIENAKINRIQPFNVDDRFPGFVDGKANNYNTQTYTYTADTVMRLKVNAFQQFVARITLGSIEVKLIVEKNGQNVAQGYWSKGIYNTSLLAEKIDKVEVETSVDMKKGDSIKIRLIVQNRSKVASAVVKVFQTSETAFASFEPDATVYTGDHWPVAINLPDLKCSEVLKTVAFQMSGWFHVDNRRKTVELVKLTDITNNRANALDWSNRLEESNEAELIFQVDPYGQRNLLKYREQEGVDKKYGDGVIHCENKTLVTESTLFELPFAATMPSSRAVADYGSPPLVETRTASGSGENIQIQKKATSPRLLLVEPTKTFAVPTQVLNSSGVVVPATVTLTGCWFARREQAITTNENAFSLAFDPVPGQISEQSLIARNFGGLKRVLRRPRVLIPSIYLQPSDMMQLDLARPIRLRNVRVGEMEITDCYFYLNRVNNYRAGGTCTVTLIAF